MKNLKLIIYILIALIIIICVVTYGFYEKHRKEELYTNFKLNKNIMCGNKLVKKSNGWRIHNNKFFTDGKTYKTIVFCKSIN